LNADAHAAHLHTNRWFFARFGPLFSALPVFPEQLYSRFTELHAQNDSDLLKLGLPPQPPPAPRVPHHPAAQLQPFAEKGFEP
jgi:hypothetical protein